MLRGTAFRQKVPILHENSPFQRKMRKSWSMPETPISGPGGAQSPKNLHNVCIYTHDIEAPDPAGPRGPEGAPELAPGSVKLEEIVDF